MDKPVKGWEATVLPSRSSPVSLQRKLTADGGMQEENYAWLPYLADGVGKRCIGRHPMSIPVAILTASGHPRRETRKLVAAFAKGAGGDCLNLEGIREYRDIRQHCLRCVENDAEVRRCTTINCPFWPYRMGRNPHNPKRGTNHSATSYPSTRRRAHDQRIEQAVISP